MQNYWATSDWHFMHRKMMEQIWDERPPNYMSLIIDNYCEVVQPDDFVWLLGDMLFAPHKTKAWFSHIVRDLPGKKFLVRGNHDCTKRLPNSYWTDECGIVTVFPHHMVVNTILFSHFPMVPSAARKDNRYFYESMLLHDEFKTMNLSVNLHGHTHTYHSSDSRCINVGVDVHSMRPMNISHLIENKRVP